MIRLWDEVNLGSVNHSKAKETNGRTLAGEVASPRDRSAAQRSALVERRRFLAQRPGPHGAPTAPHCQMARAFCGHGSGRLGGSAPPWTAQARERGPPTTHPWRCRAQETSGWKKPLDKPFDGTAPPREL